MVVTLKFMMVQNPVGESIFNVIEEEVENLSAETKTFMKEFSKLF